MNSNRHGSSINTIESIDQAFYWLLSRKLSTNQKMDGKNNPIRGESPNGNEQPTSAQRHFKSTKRSTFEFMSSTNFPRDSISGFRVSYLKVTNLFQIGSDIYMFACFSHLMFSIVFHRNRLHALFCYNIYNLF